LASKLVGWDIEIMTHEELAEGLERAERWFGQLPHVNEEMIQALIGEGFLSYNDITFIDAAEMAAITGLGEEAADEVVMYAEEYSDTMEASVEEERAQLAAAQAAEQAAIEAAIAAEEPAQAEAGEAEAAVPEEQTMATEDTPATEATETPV
jgi:N utilization substance protein A